MNANEFISHYGKKGMRWGSRKTSSNKIGASKDAKRAATSFKKAKKNSVKSLSNKELKDLSTRIELERKYSSLAPSKLKKGQDTATKILAAGATINAVIAFANSPAGRAIKNRLT